jgi:transposase
MMNSPPLDPTRFVALDLHKHYLMIGAVDAKQKIVLPNRRLSLAEFPDWATKHLKRSDAVVLEATTNAWQLYDQLQPLVESVTVANSLLVKLITSARVKTDARDTMALARLLAAGLVPSVWVPPLEVRELRALVAHRQRLIRQRTQTRNRLQSMLHRHNFLPPTGGLFSPGNRPWWESLVLGFSEKLLVRQDLSILDNLLPLIAEVEDELARLSTVEPWASQVPFLVQLPGIGLLSAMVLLSAIGDIGRFLTAKKLVGYSGLGVSVHASGQVYRTGRITKQGRRELRWVMVEAAWAAVEHSPKWKAEYARLEKRLGSKKAIVAIARKLLVVVWHVLTEHVADRQADPERVAFKMMSWSWRVGPEGRQGVGTMVFIRRQLTTLGLGASLETISRSKRSFKLPPVEAASANVYK